MQRRRLGGIWQICPARAGCAKKYETGLQGVVVEISTLTAKKGLVSSIPALRESGQWVLDGKAKADLFVTTFSKKYILAAAEDNLYSTLQPSLLNEQSGLADVTHKDAEDVLSQLREDSGTGPDHLPARILKYCAKELAKPVRMLTLLILATGTWPEMWLQHWVAPLFKRKNVYDPSNYRGIHLTAQLSKVVERLVKALFVPFVTRTIGYGPNQFAYSTGRGARDALATLVLKWVDARWPGGEKLPSTVRTSQGRSTV